MLNDAIIKSLKGKDRPYKVTDGKGLYVYISKAGSKSFRIDYSFQGKRRTLSLGAYPTITLEEARHELLELKRKIRNNIDPRVEKNNLKNIVRVERVIEHKKIELDIAVDKIETLLTKVERILSELKEYKRSVQNA